MKTGPHVIGLLAAIGASILASACAMEARPEDTDPATTERVDDGDADGESVESTSQAVTYNACACLDLSRISDCDSAGRCESYRKTTRRDDYYCKKTDRHFTCPHFRLVLCRASNHRPNGLACCSGRSAVSGGVAECL
jgi:hypothetical protein